MSTRENILAAVATALAGVASGRVYRERKEQLPALPAVVILPGEERAEEVMLGAMDADLDVAIEIYAKGDTPSAAADATLAAVHAALMADLSLGLGADVQIRPRHSVRWDYDQYDEARAVVVYTVAYRTTFGGM